MGTELLSPGSAYRRLHRVQCISGPVRGVRPRWSKSMHLPLARRSVDVSFSLSKSPSSPSVNTKRTCCLVGGWGVGRSGEGEKKREGGRWGRRKRGRGERKGNGEDGCYKLHITLKCKNKVSFSGCIQTFILFPFTHLLFILSHILFYFNFPQALPPKKKFWTSLICSLKNTFQNSSYNIHHYLINVKNKLHFLQLKCVTFTHRKF